MSDVSPQPCATVAQTAKAWNCSEQHVRNLAKRRVIPSIRLGRSIRIPVSALTDLTGQQAATASQKEATK